MRMRVATTLAIVCAAAGGASAAEGPAPADPAGSIVGIWNFCAADERGVVRNARPGGGGVAARLVDFAPEALAGTDVQLADFSIVRDDATAVVQVARSGWATFAGVHDNGLDAGVATPIGPRALAIHAANPGTWVHFPGLATELGGRPGRGSSPSRR
jgi:hypothetical protein